MAAFACYTQPACMQRLLRHFQLYDFTHSARDHFGTYNRYALTYFGMHRKGMGCVWGGGGCVWGKTMHENGMIL